MSNYKGKTKKSAVNTYTTRYFEAVIYLDEASKKKRFRIINQLYYDYEIDNFKVGESVSINVTSKKRKRSENQNRYMHLYFSLIALSSGHTMNQIKTWAKGKFLSKGITEVFKDRVRLVQNTSDLTVLEMIEFIARIEAYTDIPAPDPAPFSLAYTWEEYRVMKEKQKAIYEKLKPYLK